MKSTRYVVPDSAPVWVKNLLTGSPSRQSILLLASLSVAAALAIVWAERGKLAALLSLVFIFYAVFALLALRWADRNGVFDKK